jgi:hypothetical protein
MPLDLARSHPPRIQRQNLVVEALEPPLALPHQPGLERTISVARHLDHHFRGPGLHLLADSSIAGVAPVSPFDRVLFVPEVRGQLTLERPLHQALSQLLDQSRPAEDLFRTLPSDQVIEQIVQLLSLDHGTPPA